MGSGCAFLDYDNDGRQDILLVNSCDWPDTPVGDRGAARTLKLYRNQGGRFQDVTRQAGLDITLYGMGVACGDFDNDGWVDVFLSAVGGDRLFHNLDGSFRDITRSAGVAGPDDGWSTSSAWLDYDNDGDLDLFVCRYLDWDLRRDQQRKCRLPNATAAYCPPSAFAGAMPALFRNDGAGTFTDVSEAAGMHLRTESGEPLAKALGVSPADLDRDGWIDLVVANDTVRNVVFHNRRDGTFREIGVPAGIAYDPQGQARGAMGIDTADFRNDGSLGVAIGNFAAEMTAVYVTRGPDVQFRDETLATGIGHRTLDALTFGLLWLDYDLDSRLDLFLANGHLEPDIAQVDPGQRYEQAFQLFWNAGRDGRAELAAVPGSSESADLFRPGVGRGAACADFDEDGDLDLLVTICGGRPRLLRNDLSGERDWLRFRLIGTSCNRDAIGSWIEVTTDQGPIRRQVMPSRSYLSQVELPVTVGLGNGMTVDSVHIHWADGTRQQLASWQRKSLTVIRQPPPQGGK